MRRRSWPGFPRLRRSTTRSSAPTRRTSGATSCSTRCSTRATSQKAQHRKWTRAGLGLERGLRYDQFRYRYFFDYVQQELIERYGTNTARVGGLEVYTTLVPEPPGHG